MTQRDEHLDALIDRLLAGDGSRPAETDDRDLAELVELAREIRGLRAPDWPGEHFPSTLAGQVSRRLQDGDHPDAPRVATDNGSATIAGFDRQQAASPESIVESATESPRGRLRQVGEMTAAAIVLVLITGGLILAYQNLIGEGNGISEPATEPTEVTADPTTTPGDVTPTAEVSSTEPVLVTGPYGSFGEVSMDGGHAVWIADDSIQGASLSDREVFTVEDELTHPSRAGVHGEFVVWDEADPTCGNGCPSVHGKNLSTGDTFTIAESQADQLNLSPAISGTWVTWIHIDRETNSLAIMTRDVSTMAEPSVLVERPAGELDQPVIDGQRVIWVEGDDDDSQLALMLGDLDTGEVRTLAEDGTALRYDIHGDVVVYVDPEWRIKAIDLATGTTTTVQEPIEPDAFVPGKPTTDGRYVVWSQTPADGSRPQLRGHDLSTGESFDLTEQGTHSHPALAGGLLAWTHSSQETDESSIRVEPLDELRSDQRDDSARPDD